VKPVSPSARLFALRQQAATGSITLGSLAARLGHAATGTLLLMCGLAGLVPGLAVVLGVPLCLMAIGLLLGREHAWIPGRFRDHPIPGYRLVAAIDKTVPRLRWLEQRLHPRATWVMSVPGRRAIGVAALTCGVLIVLPVPFGNTAPAVATVLLAAGLVIGDGIAVLAGLGCTVLALAVDACLVLAGYETLRYIADRLA
jgi:hypothetical protein